MLVVGYELVVQNYNNIIDKNNNSNNNNGVHRKSPFS